jgi:hypothetical protein
MYGINYTDMYGIKSVGDLSMSKPGAQQERRVRSSSVASHNFVHKIIPVARYID